MPCRDGREDIPSYNDYIAKNEIKRLQDRNDELTRFLCGLCTTTEKRGVAGIIHDVPGLYKWWTAHKEVDRKRKNK